MGRNARFATVGDDVTAVAAGPNPVQDLVLEAGDAGTPLRIAGRSHWMDAGRPVAATRIASLATHSGVVDYVPGDLTITVRSGTTLREMDQITGAEGQWLPLDPHGSDDGTIGATIATGSFGPLAHAFGRARDLVLGLEFVTGDGRIVRGGGRVVKNVAGFDLVRLITGSWGTLGVVTEATLRLYSVPERPVTVAMSAPAGASALAQRMESILAAPLTPFAVELIDEALAALLGLTRRPALLLRIGGNPAAVAAQRDTLAKLGGTEEVTSDVWSQLRSADEWTMRPSDRTQPGGGAAESIASIVIRISTLPGRIAGVWSATREAAASIEGAKMHATVGLGLVRCILPAATSITDVQRIAQAAPGVTVVYERLPAAMWGQLSPGVTVDRLSQGVKRAFDPHSLLNPGILGPTS